MELDRRKVEAIKALLQDLASGSADQVPVCLRTALERGWNDDLPRYMLMTEERKREEVQRNCKRHQEEFLQSVDQLVSIAGEAGSLLAGSERLGQAINGAGRRARGKADDLSILQIAQRHTAAAVLGMDDCLVVLGLVERIESTITSGRYYSALSTLDRVEKMLHGRHQMSYRLTQGGGRGLDDRMGGRGGLLAADDLYDPAGVEGSYVQAIQHNAFVRKVDEYITKLRTRIVKKGMAELNHWLLRIRDLSVPIGRAACERMARHLLFSRGFEVDVACASSVRKGSHGFEDGEAFGSYRNVPVMHGLLKLAEALGFEKWGDLGWLPKCVPSIFLAGNAEGGKGVRQVVGGISGGSHNSELLDSLEDELHSVHIALLIHAHFGELSGFQQYYTKNRLPQGELRAMHTVDLATMTFEDFSRSLPDTLAGLVGFFTIETKLLQESDQLDGLPAKQAYGDLWMTVQRDLIDVVKTQLDRANQLGYGGESGCEPTTVLCLKEELVTLSRTLLDVTGGTIDINMTHMLHFIQVGLRSAFDLSQKNWLKGEVIEILRDDSWQPLFVADLYDFKRLVAPLDLHSVLQLLDDEDLDEIEGAKNPLDLTTSFNDDLEDNQLFSEDYDGDPLLRSVGNMLNSAVPATGTQQEMRFPMTLPFSSAYCKTARALHRYVLHCCLFNLGSRTKAKSFEAVKATLVASGAGRDEDLESTRPEDFADASRQCEWLANALEEGLLDVYDVYEDFLVGREQDRYALSKGCQIYLDSVNFALMPDRLLPILSDAMMFMLGRVMAGSPAGQRIMDEALAVVGDTSRSAFETLAAKARDYIFITTRNEISELLAVLGQNVEVGGNLWTPGVPTTASHPWVNDVITFLRVTFMTKLTFLPTDVRDSLHYLACSHIHSEVIQRLATDAIPKIDVYGLYNLKFDLRELEDFADECGNSRCSVVMRCDNEKHQHRMSPWSFLRCHRS